MRKWQTETSKYDNVSDIWFDILIRHFSVQDLKVTLLKDTWIMILDITKQSKITAHVIQLLCRPLRLTGATSIWYVTLGHYLGVDH